jgi:hypothetical protein
LRGGPPGNIVIRITRDAERETFPNDPEADALLTRKGGELPEV